MGFTSWLAENWFTLLQSTGIVGSLWYAAQSFRLDAKVRRVSNHFEIIEHHRRIWSQLYFRPELSRVRETDPDMKSKPISVEEELFVAQVIFHIGVVFEATKEGVIHPFDGAEEDIRQFFSKPIPWKVWNRKRAYQDCEFVEFIERIING